ncbi:pentatricopeptide repeat-containing protein 2, mitochondrial-like [Heteronotia binoei]|uniref:pentatricopeptide repeat-containing protein 2, mitochondrial-like n=1 Tax=Heteronotia binoei TaxID=13085 RepID=UPI00292E0F95|nr:pentatricopeptide repeat-containing protein 2, mitochondrial-like [Heteronotia binoei]XP_060091778.1 pentatricopeptide repeat-containing protein 2, mitochondrial-like [Heteronotia binoei]
MAAAVAEGSNRILREAIRRALFFKQLALASSCWNCPQGAKRYLLTEDILRLHEFQQQKLAIGYQLYGEKDAYFTAVEEKLTKNRLILKDELKMLLHLCQTESEVEVAKKVIYRYHAENKNMAFGEFKFGPLFMRLCYEMDLEAAAVELIKDQALHGFFSDSTSFNILMDLLFVKGHYECALEVLLEMKRQGVKFNKETYLLAFAICYKLNSSKSCKICTTLLEDLQFKGEPMPRRVYYFAIAFALKQNDVTKARSFFPYIMNTRSIICSNLKVLLQAESRDPQGLVQTLKQASDSSSDFVKRPEFCIQVLTTAREKLEGNPTVCVHFEEIFAKLQASGQITSLTLDDLLCRTPPTKRRYTHLLRQRQVSQRTFKPLSSALLAE